MTVENAMALTQDIQGGHPALVVAVRSMLGTRGNTVWFVWVQNPLTGARASVLNRDEWVHVRNVVSPVDRL